MGIWCQSSFFNLQTGSLSRVHDRRVKMIEQRHGGTLSKVGWDP
jgi:hypothetical protein